MDLVLINVALLLLNVETDSGLVMEDMDTRVVALTITQQSTLLTTVTRLLTRNLLLDLRWPIPRLPSTVSLHLRLTFTH